MARGDSLGKNRSVPALQLVSIRPQLAVSLNHRGVFQALLGLPLSCPPRPLLENR